jgi:HSP20 family molecular chaperone IbpA
MYSPHVLFCLLLASVTSSSAFFFGDEFGHDPFGHFNARQQLCNDRRPYLSETRFEVAEHQDVYTITATLPHVEKRNLSLNVDNGELVLKAARPAMANCLASPMYSQQNTLNKKWVLPHRDVSDSDIEARFSNGRLTLVVPKEPSMLLQQQATTQQQLHQQLVLERQQHRAIQKRRLQQEQEEQQQQKQEQQQKQQQQQLKQQEQVRRLQLQQQQQQVQKQQQELQRRLQQHQQNQQQQQQQHKQEQQEYKQKQEQQRRLQQHQQEQQEQQRQTAAVAAQQRRAQASTPPLQTEVDARPPLTRSQGRRNLFSAAASPTARSALETAGVTSPGVEILEDDVDHLDMPLKQVGARRGYSYRGEFRAY